MKIGNKDKVKTLVIFSIVAIMCLGIFAVLPSASAAPTTRFANGFEMYTPSTVIFPPTGWTTVKTATQSWYCYLPTSTQYARCNETPSMASDEWLITPVINLAGTTTVKLSFYRYMYEYGTMDTTVTVLGSTDGGITWPNTIKTYSATTSGGTEICDISSWAANQANVKIAWRLVSGSTDATTYDYFYMDDVVVSSPAVLGPTFYQNGFETWPPASWTLTASDGTSVWKQDTGTIHGPGNVVEGTYAAYYDIYSYSSGKYGNLTSPALNLASLSQPYLSFWWWHSSGSDYVRVDISLDGGTTWTKGIMTLTTTAAWKEEIIPLSGYSPLTNVKINFYGYSYYGSYDPHIDDFRIVNGLTTPATTWLTQSFNAMTPEGWGPWTEQIVNSPGSTAPDWTCVTYAQSSSPTATPPEGTMMAKFNSYSCQNLSSSRLYTTTPLNFASWAPDSIITLTFAMHHYYTTYYPLERMEVQINTGSGWTTIATYYHQKPTTYWTNYTIDLSSYSAQTSVQIGFLAISQYGYNMYIDNVILKSEYIYHDVGVVSIDDPASSIMPSGPFTPKATITNYGGYNEPVVPVECKFYQLPANTLVYDNTITTSLNIGETKQVLFPTFTGIPSVYYNVYVCTILPSDAILSNDCKQNLNVLVQPVSVRNINTGELFSTIQAAIDAPHTLNGHTIEVHDTVIYNEHVNVYKSLTIQAASKPIVDGGGGGYGFQIDAPNVTINGFEIRNCQIGIQSYGYAWGYPSIFNDLTIKNCDIHANTMNGIIIMHDTFNHVTIFNCTIHDNAQNGIGIADAAHINILLVQNSSFSGQGNHNMYFSNTNIQTINVLNTDLKNTLTWGSGMCFNTAPSTIGTLYVQGGSMVNNAEAICINQAASTFNQIWLNGVNILNNRESAILLGGGTTAQSLKIELCTFTGTNSGWEDIDMSGGWFGAFNSPSVLIQHNNFNGPAWCGLYIGNAGVMPSITLLENNFYIPSLYGVYNTNPTTVQATCNYWGHNTGARHTSMPTCSQGRYVYGNAVVKPYLYAAYPGGICIDPLIANPDGPYNGNVGQTINFAGSATGGQSPYTYYWTLSDGATSTLQNPTHNYWTAGYYPVTLTVTDSLGIVSCSASTSVTIVPVGTTCQPEVWVDDEYTTSTPGWQVTHFALLQFALDAVCPGGIVHVYPGNYEEDLNAYTASTDGVTIIGENIPLTFNPLSGNSAIIHKPLTITGDYITVKYLVFDASTTGAVIVSGDHAVVQYNKFLRDCLSGNPIGIENLGQANLDARFNWWGRPDGPSGNTLDANTGRIADGLGVQIIGNGPVLFDPWAGIDAVAKASKTVADTGESILFNSVDSFANHFDGTSNNFDVFWEFGDGVVSMENQVAHVYSTPGTYNVILRIESQDPQLWGAFMYDWDYLTITVTNPGAPLTANGDGSNLAGYETTVGEQIQLYGLAVGGTQPYTYSWDLGDGANSNIQNPIHIYNKAGTYTATLTVTDNVGATASDTTQIKVYNIGELIVNIITDRNTITGSENIFTATVTGGTEPYSYSWNFGDQAISTDPNPTHIYKATGTYTVTLTVTDNANHKVSDTITVTVDEGKSDITPAEIKQVNGGIRITATIAAGDTNCDWTINVQANFMLLGGEASGTIQSNTQQTVKLPLTLAFGKVQITVNANEITKQYTAIALGPIFLNLQAI